MNSRSIRLVKVLFLFFLGIVLLLPVQAEEGDKPLIEKYRPIWQAAFQSRNGFSPAEFTEMIVIRSEEIMRGNWSNYYRVDYTLRRAWIETPCHDQVLIYMKNEADMYRHMAIPRDTWFSATDFAMAIEKRLDNTEMTSVSPFKTPMFSSLEAAKQEVTQKTGIRNFINTEVAFFVPGKLPRSDGNPYLIFTGTKDEPGKIPGNQGHLGGPEGRQPASPIGRSGNTGIVPPASGKIPAPTSVEAPAFAGPQGRRFDPEGGPNIKAIKGYLNLIDGTIESHEDNLINY